VRLRRIGVPDCDVSHISRNAGISGTSTIFVPKFPVANKMRGFSSRFRAFKNENTEKTMAKLYFNYSTMNAGKSTMLLQAAYNYEERGMRAVLLIAAFDERRRQGDHRVAHRASGQRHRVRAGRRSVCFDR
jgi:hypothetical protein